jgi:hypothetical protein
MDPDFDKINNFIYNKIDNYNKYFDKFQKNLDIQDNKIRNVCKNKVNDTIKKNPKKTARQLINLTKMNETDDTSENEYELEKNNIENIKKNIINNKTMTGGNLDIETDISGEIEIVEEIENIKEDKLPNKINHTFIYSTFLFLFYLYITVFLLMIVFEYKIETNGIYKPIIFILNRVNPKIITST